MPVRRVWWRVGMVAVASLGAACQAIGGALTPGVGASLASTVPTLSGSDAPAGNAANAGSATDLVRGTLRVPDSRLIANNSNSLIDLGGAVAYRIMAASQLDQQPLAGALVTLVDAAGNTIATDSVRTDASGSFGIPARLVREAFVRASFSAGGKDFEFETAVLPATGDVQADIDAATTLVAAKLRAQAARGEKFEALGAETLAAFTRSVLAGLNPGNIPYMARGARDPVAALDQLVLDVPGLEESAALLGQAMAAPAEAWEVSTVTTQETLEAMKVLPGSVLPSQAGDFEVSDQGALFLPTVGDEATPVAIARIAGEQVTVFGTLPVGIQNPVRLAVASDSLFVAGIDEEAGEIRLFGGRDQLLELASYPTDLTPAQFFDRGRLAVGADGSIVMTGPEGDPITIPAPGRTAQTLAYPITPPIAQAFAYPTMPPIVVPTTPPIAVPTMPPLPTPMPVPGFDSWASGSMKFDMAQAGDGGLFVSLGDFGMIGKIVQGVLQPLAGKQGERGKRSGRGAYARFESPREIAVGLDGDIFVADVGNRQIRRLSPEGSVFLVAGSGGAGVADGTGAGAAINAPRFLRIAPEGTLYFVDTDPATLKERLRKIVKGRP